MPVCEYKASLQKDLRVPWLFIPAYFYVGPHRYLLKISMPYYGAIVSIMTWRNLSSRIKRPGGYLNIVDCVTCTQISMVDTRYITFYGNGNIDLFIWIHNVLRHYRDVCVQRESWPKAFDMSAGIPNLPIISWSVDNIHNRVLCCKSISINYDIHDWFLCR